MAQKRHLSPLQYGELHVPSFSRETLLRLLCEEYISHDNATM